MKDRKVNIALLLAVAVIWIIIIYKIVQGVDVKSYTSYKTVLSEDSLSVSVSDTFELIANYRDPFLGGRKKENKKISSLNSQSFQQKQVIKPIEIQPTIVDVIWPEIIYSGSIENKSKGTLVAAVQVGTTNLLVKQQESYMGVSFLLISQDSVLVQYKNQKKAIFKR
jgi:hypothetical protein